MQRLLRAPTNAAPAPPDFRANSARFAPSASARSTTLRAAHRAPRSHRSVRIRRVGARGTCSSRARVSSAPSANARHASAAPRVWTRTTAHSARARNRSVSRIPSSGSTPWRSATKRHHRRPESNCAAHAGTRISRSFTRPRARRYAAAPIRRDAMADLSNEVLSHLDQRTSRRLPRNSASIRRKPRMRSSRPCRS